VFVKNHRLICRESAANVSREALLCSVEKHIMSRFIKPFFWVLFPCFLAGCAHTSNLSNSMLSMFKDLLHIGKTDSEAVVSPAVCVLDPTANLPKDTRPPVQASKKDPSVQLSETAHDFGEITEDGTFSHDFRLKNTGNGVLQIKKIRPG
jgi:hypothetical protein